MGEASRRFPAPWRADRFSGGYVVRDANGQALVFIYRGDGALSACCSLRSCVVPHREGCYPNLSGAGEDLRARCKQLIQNSKRPAPQCGGTDHR